MHTHMAENIHRSREMRTQMQSRRDRGACAYRKRQRQAERDRRVHAQMQSGGRRCAHVQREAEMHTQMQGGETGAQAQRKGNRDVCAQVQRDTERERETYARREGHVLTATEEGADRRTGAEETENHTHKCHGRAREVHMGQGGGGGRERPPYMYADAVRHASTLMRRKRDVHTCRVRCMCMHRFRGSEMETCTHTQMQRQRNMHTHSNLCTHTEADRNQDMYVQTQGETDVCADTEEERMDSCRESETKRCVHTDTDAHRCRCRKRQAE